MKILEMTASFGCLDHRTMELSEGVNVFVLPNESGKSTWAAFLLAMFYGIDFAERAAKGRLPAKTRYLPWNGAPMEGTVTLKHNGQRMVLQRTSEKGRPMGVFRAYDPDTGLDIPGLTGENCGQKLLGVEKEVFRRTAFLSGGELTVTREQDLARRLSNLAASGDAGESYPAAAETLKGWKNRLRYHSRGQIPETEARLAQQTRVQEVGEALLRRQKQLQAQIAGLEAARTAVPGEKNTLPWLLLAVLCLLAAIAAAVLGQWILTACLTVGAAVGTAIYYVNRKQNQKIRQIGQQARQREDNLRGLQTDLAVTEARLADLPPETDAAALEQDLEELLFRERALELAMEALEQAEGELAKGYGPKLTACAGEILTVLTDHRYNALLLDRELNLSLRESATGLVRPLISLSKGTQDQAWLALRLAMTRLLLRSATPIILDDALMTFDDRRTAAALSLLAKEDRQILLLSCREL